MLKFREALTRFMRGRYGVNDGLEKLLLIVYLVVVLVNVILRSPVFTVLAFVIFGIWLFRLLSKNIPARAREELGYQRLRSKISEKTGLLKNRWRDRKTHVYRYCPYCKSVIRLPKKKGEHGVCCPCCRRDFRVRI